ncbi:hypothetical protein [Brumimicrobium aurantiacum]|uniref:Uncharacterized protein n=1 Tax=Brumimicrobium aurantiacum TaxID=1737063 RepID=A0A3E1EZ80_9FLAO|nr:hypothetical protein [Brumimicrobium aurantiacum]RFC54872.1 hypothetical protein DXU93_03360 [Brumimicrobium aurantiacum]
MQEINKIALHSEQLIFDINYKVQDLNLALLQLTVEVEDIEKKDFLRKEIIEAINQLLKFQNYIDKKRISLVKVYNLFEMKKVDIKQTRILQKPTKALYNV